MGCEINMKKDDQIQFDNEVDASINEALTMIPKKSLSNLPMIKEYKGVPEWYDFEQLIWEKGEMIRQLISNNRTCELNQRQIEKIVQIATDSKAKRGRQSFVMLLGRKKYLAYAERIAQQICDDDVVGQTIVTLSKM